MGYFSPIESVPELEVGRAVAAHIFRVVAISRSIDHYLSVCAEIYLGQYGLTIRELFWNSRTLLFYGM